MKAHFILFLIVPNPEGLWTFSYETCLGFSEARFLFFPRPLAQDFVSAVLVVLLDNTKTSTKTFMILLLLIFRIMK